MWGVTSLIPSEQPLGPRISTDCLDSLRRFSQAADEGDLVRARAGLKALLVSGTIPVQIDATGLGHQNVSMFETATRRGIAMWSSYLPETRFSFSEESNQCLIKVNFVDHLSGDHETQGVITVSRSICTSLNNETYKLKAEISVLKWVGSRLLTEDEATEVISHELGHLVGLDDHTQKNGIMGPFVPGRPRLKLSWEEIEMLQNYRSAIKDSLMRTVLAPLPAATIPPAK